VPTRPRDSEAAPRPAAESDPAPGKPPAQQGTLSDPPAAANGDKLAAMVLIPKAEEVPLDPEALPRRGVGEQEVLRLDGPALDRWRDDFSVTW